MSKPFFITTAIDYTNGAPHIGHAYEKVLADVLARYHRLKGDDVFFLTGVDQHGQKVQQSAEKAGVAPQEFVDAVTAKFTALWEKLDVRYDRWAATTDPLHKECVRANLQKLWDDKDPATGESRWIYKKTQRGFYSVRQEQFLTEKERGPDGEFGPEWGQVEEREEENFYFRLMQDPATGLPGFDPKQWLLDFIAKRSAEGHPFVVPDFRVAELSNAVAKLEGDLCISRPASRLKWGIPFPESFGEGFVTFVWFDALVNYISFVPGHDPHWAPDGGPTTSSFAALWPPLHVIGKDILIPAHGVYWPVMLKALGFSDEEMPTLLVHGWWNIAGAKMSKSLGNSIDPVSLAATYGVAATRFYLMSDITTGRDADFSEERLVQRYNTDLANSLGNLLNRSVSMARRYRNGQLRRLDSPLALFVAEKTAAYTRQMEASQVSAAIESAWEIVIRCNAYVEECAPWKLAKDPTQADKLDEVLYSLCEALRIVSILVTPLIPKEAEAIRTQLAWMGPVTLESSAWGLLPEAHQVGEPSPLFPRIEAA